MIKSNMRLIIKIVVVILSPEYLKKEELHRLLELVSTEIMSKQLDSLVQPDNSTHQNMQHSGNRKFDNLFGNAPSSSRAAEKRPAGMAPGEDFHPGAKVDDMGAENSSQQGDLTSTQRQTMIKNILDAPNDVKAIRNAWEKSIPGDLVMSYKHLKAAVHPDKFHDVLEKDQAQRAFQSNISLAILGVLTNG